MPAYYPHKQTVIIAVICVAAVSVALIYVHWQTPQISAIQGVEVGIKLSAQDSNSMMDVASSSTDWQKDFFGTITNTSTASIILKKSDLSQTKEVLTPIDQVSRNFFARYIQLKQGNLDNNQQLVQDTIDQTIDAALNAAAKPKAYTTKDIRMAATNDTGALRTYGNTIGNIFMYQTPKASPADIASEAINSGNLDALSGVDSITEAYQNMLEDMLKTTAPQSLTQFHLNLVNAMSILHYVSQALRNIQSDPVTAIAALKVYTGAQDAMRGALAGMKKAFDTAGISFSVSEPGRIFSTISSQ